MNEIRFFICLPSRRFVPRIRMANASRQRHESREKSNNKHIFNDKTFCLFNETANGRNVFIIAVMLSAELPAISIRQVKCVSFFQSKNIVRFVRAIRIELAGAMSKQCFIRTFRNCKAVSGDLLQFHVMMDAAVHSIQFARFVQSH